MAVGTIVVPILKMGTRKLRERQGVGQGLRSRRGGAWRPGSSQGLCAPLCPLPHPTLSTMLTRTSGCNENYIIPQPLVLVSKGNGGAETKTRTDRETQKTEKNREGDRRRPERGWPCGNFNYERWASVLRKKSFLRDGRTQINTLLCQTGARSTERQGRCRGNQPFPSNCSGTLFFKQEMVACASWKNYWGFLSCPFPTTPHLD